MNRSQDRRRPEHTAVNTLIRERATTLLNAFHEHLSKQLQTELPFKNVEAHFLVDGAPVVSQERLSRLPPAARNFFTDGRVGLPPALHVSRDLKEPDTFHMRSFTESVSLRGTRFYAFDGKYNWGPNEVEAYKLLLSNLHDNAKVLSFLAKATPRDVEEWLILVGAWEYIRNDLSALFYLYKAKYALEPSAKDLTVIKELQGMLDLAFEGYFSQLLALPQNRESSLLLQSKLSTSIFKQDASVTTFLKGHPTADLVRSHRELATPQSLLFAANLAYFTNKVEQADVVIAPLFGGLDIAQALRYFQDHPELAEIFGSERDFSNTRILTVIDKILPRGKPRSQQQGLIHQVASQISLLNTEDPRLQYHLRAAGNILLVDDSFGTGSSLQRILLAVSAFAPPDCSFDLATAHAGTPWASDQGVEYQNFAELDAVSITPLTNTFKRTTYKPAFSAYMPDQEINRMVFRSERTILDIAELKQVLPKLIKEGVVHGIGYDLYETLVERNINREQRRALLHQEASLVFQRHGIPLSNLQYERIALPIWRRANKEAANQLVELNINQTLLDMVVALHKVMGFSMNLVPLLVEELKASEYQVEWQSTEASAGTLETLDYMAKLGIPQAIYSNTPYDREFMMRVISKTGINERIPDEACFFSSETGILKPHPDTMTALANFMGISVSNMAFVGNSTADYSAAINARAIPIHLLHHGRSNRENNGLEDRIRKFRKLTR